jgi:CubicO group peptidase (beta-lactamase class C family)
LGVVVARISGQPFEDFLRTRIFEPLQMTHTVAYVKGKNAVADRAYGHSKEAAILKETDQSSTSATLGDGGIYSNLEDLAKWDDALTSHQLLSAAEMQPALTPGVLQEAALSPGSTAGTEPQSPSPASYGFGWFLELNGPHPHMWHYGETIGFKSAILRFTQDDLTIIILANRTDLDPSALAKEIARVNR